MPKTQVSCPKCRQLIPAEVEQLIDVSHDPGAKQRLLGGISNVANCQFCGFQGRLATPIVYHDGEKELLLTFFPPELSKPLDEQEKIFGPLIKQATERLPKEKRKGYLFNPQANLTYESMIQTILGKDGITPEMIKEQQERMSLLEQLMQASSNDVRSEIIKENTNLIDEQFFALFSRMLPRTTNKDQDKIAKQLTELQKQLLEETDYGRELQASVAELEAASKELQDAGQELTREKLLELVIKAPNDARIKAYVSMARTGMDYTFFQNLTEKLEAAKGTERNNLEALREKLLDAINEVDRQLEAQYKEAQALIDEILDQEDVAKATQENIQRFTQQALELVNQMFRQASEKNDYSNMGKLQKMLEVLQKASTPPPEMGIIEQLLESPDEAGIEKILKENEEKISEEFINTLTGLMSQMEAQNGQPGNDENQSKALIEKLNSIYKTALKFSMKKNMG
ncbi:MAG: CpXC domain-containing protein [Anaerolineae bacterium]|nr:CpXC domain-containing protein [Anaerolineae bacterium]